MPVTINGSPTHVFIVHIVVVLLPLSVLGAILLVAVPKARRAFSLLTLLIGFIACIAIPFAFSSGSALRAHVGASPLISRHVALAHDLLPLAAVFGLALAAFVGIDLIHRSATDDINVVERWLVARSRNLPEYARTHRLSRPRQVSAALLVLLALATGVQVYRVGDAGAKASWQGRLTVGHHAP